MRWWLMALLTASACSGSDDKDTTEVGDDDDDTTGDDDDDDDGTTTGDDDDDDDDGLSQSEFGEAFADAFCQAAQDCGSSADLIDAACAEPTTTTTSTAECTYDAAAAQVCLDEGFTCEEAAGLVYPLPADACLVVFDCPDPTTTTTTTTPELPSQVDAMSWTCFGTPNPYDGWSVEAEMGPGIAAASATVLVANTAYVPYGALYFEEHPMALDLDDDWVVDTTPVQDLLSVVPGDTSLADCIDLSSAATAIVRVYDAKGTLVDCAAAGHDPQGWIDGDYDADWFAPIRDDAELASCRVL